MMSIISDFDKFSSINVEESIANFVMRGVLTYIGTSDLRYVSIFALNYIPVVRPFLVVYR